jgi:DNA-directed RNA polymerase specialized sigma subunit
MTTDNPQKPKKTKRDKNPDTPEFTSKYYVTNGKMLPEVIKSKEKGQISPELAKMLMTLTRKYAQRPCFSNYTYKEDMISEALANLCKNALKFKPEKSSNPFSFYTTCINNSFLHFLNVEKKHRRTRDQLLIDMGENPSFNFQEESRNHQDSEYRDDFAELKTNIEEAKVRMDMDAIHAAAKAATIAAIMQKLMDEQNGGKHVTEMDDIDPELEAELIPNLALLDFEGEDNEDKE